MKFEFGTVSVPNGKRGPWSIDTFTLTEQDVLLDNLRALRDGAPELVCDAGTYKRLHHKERGCIMSNTPMEVLTAREAYDNATGCVLVNGLGLGMVLEGMLSKKDVTYVRVIELDSDVIRLVKPTFAKDHRVEIICADAHEYTPERGETFDYVWHDIWDTISQWNIPSMSKLVKKYSRIATAQGVWSKQMALRMRRRNS